jgi:hypothetical protein
MTLGGPLCQGGAAWCAVYPMGIAVIPEIGELTDRVWRISEHDLIEILTPMLCAGGTLGST